MVESINQLIKSEKFPPVIFLFGEEDFLVEENSKNLFSAAVESISSKYDSDILSGFDIDADGLLGICSSYPFIAKRRVVWVRHFEEIFPAKLTKKNTEPTGFLKYLKSPQETTCLIISGSNDLLSGMKEAFLSRTKTKLQKIIKSASQPYSTLLENHEWIEFGKIAEADYPQWIADRVKDAGKSITVETAGILALQTNTSLRDLNNEIEKLLIRCRNRINIDEAIVHEICGSSRKYNVFELQKAVGKRNLQLSLEILEKMISAERQEILVITVLSNFFIALWKLAEEAANINNRYQLATTAGISYYFIGEYLEAIKKYRAEEIENAILQLCRTDEELKSSSADSLYILEKMLVSIIGVK